MAEAVDIKKRQLQVLREEKTFRAQLEKGIDEVFDQVFENFVEDYMARDFGFVRLRMPNEKSQAAEPGSEPN